MEDLFDDTLPDMPEWEYGSVMKFIVKHPIRYLYLYQDKNGNHKAISLGKKRWLVKIRIFFLKLFRVIPTNK